MEFMPLSKRINNLHINNGLLFDNITATSSLSLTEWGPGPPFFQNPPNMPETPPEPVQNIDWNKRTTLQYSPELNETQNPYYFNINKLLFEMYVERLQRSGQL